MARRKIGPKRKYTVAFDLNDLNHEIRNIINREGNGILGELAQKIAEEARNLAPSLPSDETPRGPNKRGGDDRSGPLKQGIFAARSAKVANSWIVCSPAWYSHFVEYGTAEHDITPNRESALVFPGTNEFAGKKVVVKKVHHPKVRQKPFLRPAADKAEQFLQEIISARHS